MVLPSSPPVAAPPTAAPEIPRGILDALVDASLRLDVVERPHAGLRADEPAHRTVAGRPSPTVVVRPGWGGRRALR